jgi:hypothetical protein
MSRGPGGGDSSIKSTSDKTEALVKSDSCLGVWTLFCRLWIYCSVLSTESTWSDVERSLIAKGQTEYKKELWNQ